MGTQEGASAGRKPWRYYYVMALPLGGGSGTTQDKLQEITEMTAAIEQREEEYLHKVAAKNAAHAAAVEAERKAVEGKQKPPMSSYVAWVLRRLHATSVVVLVAAIGVLYVWYKHDDGRDHVPPSLVGATLKAMGVLLAVHAVGWVAAWRCSINGARVLLLVGVVLIICLTLALDETNIIRRSQNKLYEALASSEDTLTQDTIELILNGGTTPSLVQRFVFDGPSAFIWWLSAHCTESSTTRLSYESVVIDRREFFSPLWNDKAKSCAAGTLGTWIRANAIAQPVIIGEVGLLVLQVFFTGLFLAVCDPLAPGKASAKRQRQLSLLKPTSNSRISSTAPATALFTRLLVFGTALFGSSNALASTDLLGLCSIVDFHAVFTWVVIVSLLSGLSALIAALFVGCGWKQRLAAVLLVLAVASEVFMLVQFIKIAARLVGPDITAELSQTHVQDVREVYIKASSQTCSSVKRWISHVCVTMAASETPTEFDLSCQHEFVALLVASFNFTDTYLTWSLGVKLVLLVQLILPALRQAAVNVLNYLCCISPRDEFPVGTVENSLQQSSPPVDYDEALDIYLTTVRVRDPGRLATEREAFEKEWSTRTGRKLADVRTPNVVVTASDFGAIVRTLMLRRLTAICKLDLSLSVSNDGKMIFVHIFASDNLLLATLCEMEAYRLQFADAIDPGRRFWRDKKEVIADQKVLDANTAKHKLKLLLTEKAMHPKEAVWFPGESLPRVSARIHALSRISRVARGMIRCHNPAPAFASYSPNIQRQFIYKKYPNRLEIPDTYRRSVVLRTIDCIRITRCIIDAEFDVNAATLCGLVSSLHCLHSASRFDFNSRSVLASAWITFWRPSHLPGELWPDDYPILNLLCRVAPFRQPLQSVRDYFGEKIAFYFAWIAFYGKMMLIPAVASTVAIACRARHSLVSALWIFFASPHSRRTDNGGISESVDKIGATLSLPELILGLVVIAWSFGLAKLWERRSLWYQLQWGVTTNDTASNVNSLNFDSNHTAMQKPSICSELVPLKRQLGSWTCILFLGSANLMVVLSLLLSQGMLVDVWGEKFAVLGSCGCQALLVQWNGASIPSVARALTRWEYSRSSSGHSVYRTSVVAKMFILQLFNTFTGLMLLMLSSIGGLEMLVHFVVPLRPLYVSYNARIEGNVGIFIQIETLALALFGAQLAMRIVLILTAVKRFSEVKRGEQGYKRKQHEEETTLPTFPGPNKDYAQIVMQLGLITMFSTACPLLPLFALVDCAVKLRQNALELCCIRQRPEPEGVQYHGANDDDISLGLWAPWLLLMLKISVPIALALTAFTADNFDDISIERRVGWWLVGVLVIWLAAQLLWFLIPRESRHAEEARARNTFLVERYFGRAEVNEKKAPSKEGVPGKHSEKQAASLQEPPPSAEHALHHYKERLELLQRLNVALRKREDIGIPFVDTENVVVSATGEGNPVQGSQEQPAEELHSIEAQHGEAHLSVKGEAMQRVSESSEEMIAGYFRPVHGAWPPTPEQPAEDVEEKKDMPGNIAEAIEAPMLQQPRRGSPGPLPLAEMKISNTDEEGITPSRVESASGSIATGRPAPMRLSKLFKRMPAAPSTIEPYSASDDDEAPIAPPTSPYVSPESSFPQPDLDPEIYAPVQLSLREGASSRGDSHDDDIYEEKPEAPISSHDEPRVSITPATREVDSASRRFSPRLSFFRRKSKTPASTHSDDGSAIGGQAEASEQTLLRQLSPRMRSLTRKSQSSSSKVSDSEESKSSVRDIPAVPEPPTPRKLSKLFKRVQPPPTAAPPPLTPPPPSAVPPLVDAAASSYERAEVEDIAVNRLSSVRDQFDFLSDAYSETTPQQRRLTIQRRQSSRSIRPPSEYTKVDLSGLDAVREAANRRQFDFSADEEAWQE